MIFLTLFFFLLGDPPSTPTLASGDAEFARINYPMAISIYEEILKSSPADPEILWRLARVYICMGDMKEGKEKLPFFKKAEAYARQCILSDPARYEGHSGLAAALGSIAIHSDRKTQVTMLEEIKHELDRAIEINPADDVAYSVLGSMYRSLGNTGWLERQLAAIFFGPLPAGGHEEAERALKRAIQIAPHVMRHHYELGVVYVDLERNTDALNVFRHAATLPVLQGSDRERLMRIHEFLEKLE